jgi:hypothetical protein
MKHLLLIVARAEYLRHDVQLMVVMLGGPGQLRCDVEFLILIESQACCVRGFQPLCEQILHDKHTVGLHTRDAARALTLHLQLGRTALAMFRDKYVVARLEGWRRYVRLVVVLRNSGFAITGAFLCHLCMNLRHCRNALLLAGARSTAYTSTSFA